jgi:hypothetical protein
VQAGSILHCPLFFEKAMILIMPIQTALPVFFARHTEVFRVKAALPCVVSRA